jgi:hypothetical protein
LREAENAIKQKESELKTKKEDRYIQQRLEAEKRALERQQRIKLMSIVT